MIMLLAFFTMLVDHIGMIFFPGEEIWRIIGRMAFPLFAWGIVRGFLLTSNRERYAKRIFILAIISQIPFLFFGYELFFNVCFTLLFGLLSLQILEQKKLSYFIKVPSIVILLILAWFFHFDYGAYGVLTIILIFLFWGKKRTFLYFLILTFLFYNIDFENFGFKNSIQIYSIIALFLVYFTPMKKYDFKLNFWFKYGFYPVHLMILYIIFLFL